MKHIYLSYLVTEAVLIHGVIHILKAKSHAGPNEVHPLVLLAVL